MSHPPLILTPELELDLSDPHSLTLRYPGDVHLSQTFGRPLAGAQVGGDLHLDLPEVTGTCVAQGDIRTSSNIDAIRLTGRELHLSGEVIRARALSASERILIGPCTLKVDVIIAPVVHIHPEARGRVTVVECRNEVGPTKIRGEFTLQEYEENFGGAMEFLAGRGVGPLEKGLDIEEILARPRAVISTVPPDEPQEDQELEPEELHPEELEFVDVEPLEDLSDADSFDGVSALPADALDTLEPEDEDHEEDVEEPATEITPLDPVIAAFDEDVADTLIDEDAGIIEPARPLPPRASTPMPPPPREDSPTPVAQTWFLKLDAIVQGIEAAYESHGNSEVPDAVRTLRDVIESRQVERVTHELDTVWTDTVKHHRQARTPVDPKVAHRFRVLSDLVAHQP